MSTTTFICTTKIIKFASTIGVIIVKTKIKQCISRTKFLLRNFLTDVIRHSLARPVNFILNFFFKKKKRV